MDQGPKRVPVGKPIQNERSQPMKSIIPLSGAAMLFGSFVSVAEAQTPIILAQPTNEVVLAGCAASFSVAVSGTGPLTYQWQFNGTNLCDRVINTVAGNGIQGYLNDPDAVAVDTSGNLFIADKFNNRIREVGTNGIIVTVAGNGTGGYSGDGGPATSAEFYYPTDVAVDASGNLFMSSWITRGIR